VDLEDARGVWGWWGGGGGGEVGGGGGGGGGGVVGWGRIREGLKEGERVGAGIAPRGMAQPVVCDMANWGRKPLLKSPEKGP